MANEPIPIRLSHLLGHSGVGAIVRGVNGLSIVQDIRKWTNRQGSFAGQPIPYVERVRAALRIEGQLREPPVANGRVDDTCVPAMRFPSWMRCPSCGAMYRWSQRKDQPDHAHNCNHQNCKHKPRLEQVTWVLAHPKGYLGDVPWHFLAHQRADPSQSNCKVRDQLRLIERGYKELILRCGACRAETRFRGDERVGFGRGRVQPWTREDLVPQIEAGEKDNQDFAQVLAIHDTRVYMPVAESALVIPPESRLRKGTVVDYLYRNSDARKHIDSVQDEFKRRSIIGTLASGWRCTPKEVEDALAEIARGYPLRGESFTPGQLRESEFKAFLGTLPKQREDEDLVTRNRSDEWYKLGVSIDLDANEQKIVKGVCHLVRVDRLKAIKVFKGFTRLGGEKIVPPDIVGKADWLPAIELYGEGIFLTLDEDRLKKWEQTSAVVSRLDPLLSRFTRSGRDNPNPLTTRFMLLHVLSHLLIRQIESESGYPAASLTERIYCANAPEPMAGILIHVAVPDIAGSLGGLAELSEPRRFLGILIRALERSRWCSLDPVCSEHEGQGPGLLNRAACHACALVPEPACEYDNTLLDREFVKGDAASGLPAFFGMA